MHNALRTIWDRLRGKPPEAALPRDDSRDDQMKWVDHNADPQAVKRQAVEEVRSERAGHPVEEGGGD
jgi:hypothetical protein